jgi:hypothetical protein
MESGKQNQQVHMIPIWFKDSKVVTSFLPYIQMFAQSTTDMTCQRENTVISRVLLQW